MPPGRKRPNRRDLLTGALTAGVATIVPPADGQGGDAAITVSDIASADKMAARAFSEGERALMLKSLTETRQQLQALRKAAVSELTEPATLFDPVVPEARVPQFKSVFRPSSGRLAPMTDAVESLAFAPLSELARRIKARQVSSLELTRMYMARLKRFGPRLLCVVTLTEERALQQAAQADGSMAEGRYRGPLHGIPYGAKDLLATKGIRTTWGAGPFENRVFDYDATVIERLDAAGAVLAAKLTMGELAMGDVWFGGVTRNPWNPKQGSSGSSAGSGSATAAGLVGFSIGTETYGSIVSPCVRNSVVGLRPTFGRVSRHGAMALCWSLDKIGPMCRGVEDCALVLQAIQGADGRDRTARDVSLRWEPGAEVDKLKVGYDKTAFDAASRDRDEARRKVYADLLASIRGLGAELKPVALPKSTPASSALIGIVIHAESAAAFQEMTLNGEVSKLVQQKEGSWPNIFRVGSTIPAADYLRAMRLRRRLQQEMAEALADLDCYVTPPFGSLATTNLTGHPTLVLRCGFHDGQPLMFEITGNLYREDAILRLGFAYEQSTDWRLRHPDTESLPETPPSLVRTPDDD